ncbi:MAG: hypothetical protein QNJ81_05260 [Acidimicrobiia bacterium]|nr:hypothetical protein [Acidimicrobiia bacterium]
MRAVDRSIVEELLAYPGEDVVSLYVPVDPRDPRNQRPVGQEWWRTAAKSMLDELEPGDDRDDRLEFRRTIAGLGEFAETYTPDERTLAVFATSEQVFTIPLQVRLEREAHLGRPAVTPLLKALSAYHRYLVVLIAANRIRAVAAHQGGIDGDDDLTLSHNWGMHSATRSGHRFRFEARIEEWQRKYQAAVAAELDGLLANGEVDRVILGGAEREAHGVYRAMSDRTAEQVAGVVSVPVDADEAAILDGIAPVVRAYEDSQEREAVRRVRRLSEISGRAVLGAEDVDAALANAAVRRLVIAAGRVDRDVREDRVRKSYAQGAEVMFLFGAARNDLDEHDGVAAELYWAQPATIGR